MKEIELMIDTEEIADFFYLELTRRGYIPNEDELSALDKKNQRFLLYLSSVQFLSL